MPNISIIMSQRIDMPMILNRVLQSFLLILTSLVMMNCQTNENKESIKTISEDISKKTKQLINKDLKEIKADGKLKVITSYSATSYFLYRGQAMGFEYELLERFAESMDLELEIVIAKDLDNLIEELNQGNVDLVAHGLTITEERKKTVTFTQPLYLTKQVLVQKKPDNWRQMKWTQIENALVDDVIELIGDTISVRKNTSYFERLDNLSQEIGGEIYIDTVQGSYATEEIIKMVADGEVKYTVADKNIAKINASYYPILDVDVPISFSQRVAWVVRNDSPELLKAINDWLTEIKKGVDYYVIYNKYFKNKRGFKKRVKSEYLSLNQGKISKYDELIKKYAKKINWDWRLLASQIYQESRFQSKAKSWAGADGLMQVMPATAKELGITNRNDPEQSIRGGSAYLKQLYAQFEDIPDQTQRIKFTLAAYNCGFYHVLDALKWAKKMKLNPEKWDDHVENAILDLSIPKNYNDPIIKYGYVRGLEPFHYVEDIFKRYKQYQQLINE